MKSYGMLENAMVTVFTVSELLLENPPFLQSRLNANSPKVKQKKKHFQIAIKTFKIPRYE